MNVKRKVHSEHVLPVMVYGSETWALKKAHMELLSVAQRKMERIMLGITLRDHKRNTWIRHHGTHCTIQRQQMDKKSDRVDTGHENGQDDRENLKQDGETALSATWVLRGQE